MNKTDWPESPTLYASNEEYEISDDVAFDEWSSRMSDKLRSTAENLGWKFRISDTALSRSDKFEFIFRAMVKWETDEGDFDYVALHWLDHSGVSGSVSGPASELLDDPRSRRPFGMNGSTVAFSVSANPDWIDASSKNANDEK